MAAVHLIFGPVGAGKTIYGRALARRCNQGSTTYSIEVDDTTFDWAESYYEPSMTTSCATPASCAARTI